MKAFQLIASLFFILAATFAQAYIGPGAGISAVGTALAFVIIVLLLIVGFLWYPVKTFILDKKKNQQSMEGAENKKDSKSDEATGL